MKVKRIAVIPARRGSKRIPGKNTRLFCGKPMLQHTLERAGESALFDEIHVSTDSEETASLADTLGFRVAFMRPPELAGDHTPIIPVLKYVLERFVNIGKVFNQVWMLMPCSPLIEASDYVLAARLLDNAPQDSALLAVTEYPVPIEWAFSCSDSDFRLNPVYPGKFSLRSQDLEKRYFDAGAFSAFPTAQVISSEGAGSDDSFVGFSLAKHKVVDIDEESDWVLAESLYKALQETASS
jgi:pseudaminic acid cytidylyltransferase